MKILKILLVLLLVAVTILYGADRWYEKTSGRLEGPTLNCPTESLEVSVQDLEAQLLTGITASDKQDGDLTDQILVAGVSQLITDDTAKVTYLVFDSDKNMATCSRYIRYTDYRKPVIRVEKPLVFTSSSGTAVVANLGAEDVIDGDISDAVRISTLSQTEDSDVYRVVARVTNSMGDTAQVELPVIIQQTHALRPVVTLTEQLIYMEKGTFFRATDYLADVTVAGVRQSTADVTIEGGVDVNNPGTYWIRYSYAADGLVGMAILTVVVYE